MRFAPDRRSARFRSKIWRRGALEAELLLNGDHRHIRAVETLYLFTTLDSLLADFWDDVEKWRPECTP